MFDAASLAARLWQARLAGQVIEAASIVPPPTIEDAYAVQAQIAALSGHAVLGFKIGSTSKEAQRLLGTDEPGSAPLLAPFVFESPAQIVVSALHAPALEGEFAFRLGADLPPRAAPYSRVEIAQAIEAVAGAIEVVGTRFAGGLAGKGRLLTTADGGVNIGLVTGPWRRDWQGMDLPGHAVTMHVNGVAKGSGTGARALDDPMHVMAWIVAQQSRLGRGMKAGDIVSTGTCTGLDAVAPGDLAVADFGSLGKIEVRLVAAA